MIAANYSYNDARYRNSRMLINGTLVQLAGNRLVLSPQHLAAFGITCGGRRGWLASLTANYVGERFLDMLNTARAKAYVTADASIGYRFRNLTLVLSAYNLGNRRDPVVTSELGEGQFYRLPGRRVFVKLAVPI